MKQNAIAVVVCLSYFQLSSAAEQTTSTQHNADSYSHTNSFFEENPNFRAALRLGIDTTRVDVTRNYMSGGVEVSWLNRENVFRPELGVQFMRSIDQIKINSENVNRVTNFYGFAGLGASFMWLVVGVRLLVGNEWIDIANGVKKQDQFALGGEGRLGYEWQRGFSMFASYALTEHLQMIGMDFGMSL